jgi:hypothetical protein|tara:strand:- start:295 stop:510 length:216 start_codon:yes stop_codon:yes gene_type:complete
MILPATKEDLGQIKVLGWVSFLLCLTNTVCLILLIANAKEPNKTLTPAQEHKLFQATKSMEEVANFIKAPK